MVRTHQDVVTEAPNGGFITTQKLNITMTATVDKVDYICQATNSELLVTVDQSVTVSVMCKYAYVKILGRFCKIC